MDIERFLETNLQITLLVGITTMLSTSGNPEIDVIAPIVSTNSI
ncbi:hypothetical protein DFR30_1987 [Thiogranum longum]|uniref:Uncharacterized protein n=1 Tax=Thiogranum longum TaxID=1537524 RepID=A0A4R1HDJ9_9GAMM|nr:hypothetical protein DFR30_1987 [Thiogranum longum]